VTDDAEFKPVGRRRTLRLTSEELVRKGAPAGEGELLPIFEPAAPGVNLVAWAAGHRELVEAELARRGALLFRGFDVDSVEQFERFIEATSAGGALKYRERSSPRSRVAGNVYTSTDHPPDQSIFLHNEQSYNIVFPSKIYFFCLTPAAHGGETPVADTRKIYASLREDVRRRFTEKQYLYARNFGHGFGLSWQTAFQTTSRREVEDYCRRNSIEFEWREGDRLRTRQVRPAVARHPRTGEQVWFNHATFFHASTLDAAIRERMLEELGEEGLPNNTFYGDGTPIEPEVMEHLRGTYLREKTLFHWQQFDILMLDNMLVSHGREPFEGPRRVVAGMADPRRWDDVRLPAPGEDEAE
jgi:alpha-ketoglutarate-dependent taurine dioxygenase